MDGETVDLGIAGKAGEDAGMAAAQQLAQIPPWLLDPEMWVKCLHTFMENMKISAPLTNHDVESFARHVEHRCAVHGLSRFVGFEKVESGIREACHIVGMMKCKDGTESSSRDVIRTCLHGWANTRNKAEVWQDYKEMLTIATLQAISTRTYEQVVPKPDGNFAETEAHGYGGVVFDMIALILACTSGGTPELTGYTPCWEDVEVVMRTAGTDFADDQSVEIRLVMADRECATIISESTSVATFVAAAILSGQAGVKTACEFIEIIREGKNSCWKDGKSPIMHGHNPFGAGGFFMAAQSMAEIEDRALEACSAVGLNSATISHLRGADAVTSSSKTNDTRLDSIEIFPVAAVEPEGTTGNEVCANAGKTNVADIQDSAIFSARNAVMAVNRGRDVLVYLQHWEDYNGVDETPLQPTETAVLTYLHLRTAIEDELHLGSIHGEMLHLAQAMIRLATFDE